MKRVTNQAVVYYQFEQWANPTDLTHGVFTRLGGISGEPWSSLNVGSTVGDDPDHVAHNKTTMVQALGVDPGQAATVWQVHGCETVVMSQPTAPGSALQKADGMVTDQPGLLLVMRFADCVPILFYDPVQQVVGLAHAGWRGTVVGAGPSVVQQMCAVYGCQPENIRAGIGPSIGPERYQVGVEVVDAVQDAFGDVSGLINQAADGSSYLNLWEANRRALVAVDVHKIEVAHLCTASNTHEFYSHRAEQGKTGRFGAAIGLPSG